MILAMMIGYIVILHLIFNVFKLVQPSTRNKIYVTVLGCFLIYCVVLFINYYQPMSTDLRVVRYVIPLRTRLQGVVVEVPVQPNVPLKKGDVIFRIDPRPFEVQVARLKAALAEAEQRAKMLPVDLAAAEAAVAKADAAVVEAAGCSCSNPTNPARFPSSSCTACFPTPQPGSI
jgi:multidrug resistance efflux pump